MMLGPAVQKLLAIALLAVVLFVVWTLGIMPIQEKFNRYEASAAQSRDLIARYRRILADAPVLKSEIAAIRRNRVLKDGLLVASSADLGAAVLQGKVKQVATGAAAQLISIQVLSAEKENAFTRVGVRARLRGTVAAVLGTLFDLETTWPALVVDNVNIRARTRRSRRTRGEPVTLTAEPNLSVSFDAYGFMATSGPAAPRAARGGRK